jgi:hypothetical protein
LAVERDLVGGDRLTFFGGRGAMLYICMSVQQEARSQDEVKTSVEPFPCLRLIILPVTPTSRTCGLKIVGL